MLVQAYVLYYVPITNRFSDDPDLVDGIPSHVQIVGWRFQDEEVLSATEVISEVLRQQEHNLDPTYSRI
jgi:Asp-tRNA(Asn)/Glu-tRNA(Gln) amidotransferase A subunit family amidase